MSIWRCGWTHILGGTASQPSQCSTLVRTLCNCDAPSQWTMVIFTLRGSETSEPNHLKSGVFDYVHSPTHMQNTIAATNWGWGGYRGDIVHSHAFFSFLDPSTRPRLTPRNVDFCSMFQKTCFGDGRVLLESNVPVVYLRFLPPPPKKKFQRVK